MRRFQDLSRVLASHTDDQYHNQDSFIHTVIFNTLGYWPADMFLENVENI